MDEKTGLISRSDPTENLSDENSVILGTSNECKAPKSISSSDKRNNRIFEKEEDWALFAYCVFEAPGAVLYFFQAVLPFYSFPQLLREEELGDLDAWIGVVAGGIFVLVSFVYLKAWQVGRKNKKRSLPNGKKGWDFLANILFLIGSVGYQLTSIADLGNVHIMEARALDLLLAVLFVFDSTFYLLALFENKPRKEPTKQKSSVDRSSLDFYLRTITRKRRLKQFKLCAFCFAPVVSLLILSLAIVSSKKNEGESNSLRFSRLISRYHE